MTADTQLTEQEQFVSYDRSTPKGKGTYTVTLTVAASRLKTIQKDAEKAFGEMLLSVNKVERASSRAARLGEAQSAVEDAASTVEELKGELQDWYDNLPENFQNGDKGSDLQTAVEELEQIESSLNDVSFDSVEFPSMF